MLTTFAVLAASVSLGDPNHQRPFLSHFGKGFDLWNRQEEWIVRFPHAKALEQAQVRLTQVRLTTLLA